MNNPFPAAPLLMVGSAPYKTADETFRTWSNSVAPHLVAIPDGEVLDRRMWVQRLYYQVYNGHPDLDVVQRPIADDGTEMPIPRTRAEAFKFKVKPSVEKVKLGLPGWRLGYAKDAINSYLLFRALRDQGLFEAGTRFQVSLPTPNSVCNPAVFDLEGLDAARSGYLDALVAEIANICDHIPHEDLAIQLDSSWEITDVYGETALPVADALTRNLTQYSAICEAVPAQVQLGVHLCFGTFGGWPRFAPSDLGEAVSLTLGIVRSSSRAMDWIHIPTLDTLDKAFYAPLARLEGIATRIYLGMIHSMESFEERLAVARQFLPSFGIAAYCGFGRLTRAEMDGIVEDHLEALDLWKGD